MNTLQQELKSTGWDKKRLLVDIKCDGLRLSLGKIEGEPFIFVDPTLLKRKSPNVIKRLPTIAKELRSIPDNTVLDGEFIAVKGNEILHRTTANSLLNATKFSPEKLAKYAHIFIFDVLHFEGEDITNQPLHERLEYLQRIKSTQHIWIEKVSTDIGKAADGYILKGSDTKKFETAMDKIMGNKINRPSFIAEGVMIKTLDDPYEQPINHGWGKLKKFYEVDCVVWDKKLIKGQDDVWNYFLGINIDKDYAKQIPTKYLVVKHNDKYYNGEEAKQYI